MMQRHSRIYVAGHRGLVGSAIQRQLTQQGYEQLLTTPRSTLDLRDALKVGQWFDQTQPEYVFLAAAKVGGILANTTYPVNFLQDNLQIQTNIIQHSYRTGVKKLLFLGSSCIYPKWASQPIKEEYLLTGALEPTNEWYAVAKIAGIKLCQAYRQQYGWSAICAMPTNLYGVGDNFDLQNSHVLPALVRKFHEAKIHHEPQVTVWGTGTPRREFLYVDDLALACIFLMQNYDESEIINVGTGVDVSISELANLIQKIVNYPGEIIYDASKPDGTPRKLLDVSRLHHLGWQAQTPLFLGIQRTYEWYVTHAQSPQQV